MKDIEKHKKYLEEHYPETTDEQREKIIHNLERFAHYAFDKYLEKINKKSTE